jgi:hypothetical protein
MGGRFVVVSNGEAWLTRSRRVQAEDGFVGLDSKERSSWLGNEVEISLNEFNAHSV